MMGVVLLGEISRMLFRLLMMDVTKLPGSMEMVCDSVGCGSRGCGRSKLVSESCWRQEKSLISPYCVRKIVD